jgi:hypothetical protein
MQSINYAKEYVDNRNDYKYIPESITIPEGFILNNRLIMLCYNSVEV